PRLLAPPPPCSPPFPYTTLFRSRHPHSLSSPTTASRAGRASAGEVPPDIRANDSTRPSIVCTMPVNELTPVSVPVFARTHPAPGDRKSTRLNSSHVKISYAVFCL